jgi:hypothetical protein
MSEGKFTSQITYYDDPTLWEGKPVCFLPPSGCAAPSKASPNNPVYDRAQNNFSEEWFMYPAPPLYLGQQNIAFPKQDIYLLRLLIKMPGTEFIIPEKIGFMAPVISKIAQYQSAFFPSYNERFFYLTVRSGVVKSQKDDEFHVDGFQGTATTSVPRHIPEQNYIWADSNPTLFSIQPYFLDHIDPARYNVHTHFEAVTRKDHVYSALEKGLYIMDPYHVHARPKVEGGTVRSFFRLCASLVEIRDDTCMSNPHIPRGPYGRSDVRDRLDDCDGTSSEMRYGLKPV